MRKILCLGWALLLLRVASGQELNTTGGEPLTDTKDIRRVIDAWLQSWANHNFEDMATYAAHDMNFVNEEGLRWEGRDKVQKVHQNLHRSRFKKSSLTVKDTDIRFLKPDVALVYLKANLDAVTPPDTKKVASSPILQTLLVVKKKERWRLNSAQLLFTKPKTPTTNTYGVAQTH